MPRTSTPGGTPCLSTSNGSCTRKTFGWRTKIMTKMTTKTSQPSDTQHDASELWRCSTCGSLSVECRIWSDVNTGKTAAGDDNIEYRCLDCENDNVILESEYLLRVEEWWSSLDEHEREEIVRPHLNETNHSTVGTYHNFWQDCSKGQKIDIWRKRIYPDCFSDD